MIAEKLVVSSGYWFRAGYYQYHNDTDTDREKALTQRTTATSSHSSGKGALTSFSQRIPPAAAADWLIPAIIPVGRLFAANESTTQIKEVERRFFKKTNSFMNSLFLGCLLNN